MEKVGYHVWFVLFLIVYITQSFLLSFVIRCCYPVSWLSFHPQWCLLVLLIRVTIDVGVGDFVTFLDVGAGVGRFIGSFTLGDAVFMVVLLCLISSLVCAVSLWRDFCGVVLCLKIYANLLMACNLASTMDVNGAVGTGL